MHRRTGEDILPTVGLPTRHFVGIFNVPIRTQNRGHPFYTVIPRNHPILSPFTTRWGYEGCILDYPPPPWVLTGISVVKNLDNMLTIFERFKNGIGDKQQKLN